MEKKEFTAKDKKIVSELKGKVIEVFLEDEKYEVKHLLATLMQGIEAILEAADHVDKYDIIIRHFEKLKKDAKG